MKKAAVAIVVLVLLVLAAALWYAHGHGGKIAGVSVPSFGSAEQNTSSGGSEPEGSGVNTPLNVGGNASTSSAGQAIFLIAQGPVVAATLMAGQGSTTVARYITGDDGHVLDQTLASDAGPVVVSQTTIPGVQNALWSNGGNGALLQYLEGSTIKTVHLAFGSASSSAPQTLVQFLPDGIESVAVSPSGAQAAYLLATASGVAGYVSQTDGSNPKKLFSIPLSGVILSWPSQGELIAYSKASAGVPGIVFSINAKTGLVSPILYGLGITAAGDRSFGQVLYQIADGSAMSTYVQSLGGAAALAQGPAAAALPEQCSASGASTSTLLYCATPTSPQGGAFLDLWHQGAASTPDELVQINLAANTASVLGVPGQGEGGENSNAIGLALSPDGSYLSFINKDDGTLWGLTLAR